MKKRAFPQSILVAPGSFKESIDAWRASEAIFKGLKAILPEAYISRRPMADGGTGIARLLTEVTGGTLETTEVTGPVGEKVKARYGILGDGKTAIIESAQACGLKLVPLEKRNPRFTTLRVLVNLCLRL